MKSTTKRTLATVAFLALGLTAIHAQSDNALLNALVKKGVLSNKEAEDIRVTEEKDNSLSSNEKISIASHITRLQLYGDARFRWEYADETPQAPGLPNLTGVNSHNNIVERSRFRLRVGADYTFTDNFKAGVELESNVANDSANQTFGNAYTKYGINIGLVYLQYKPVDWLTLTGGKQRNPIYTTDLVWDPDINPEGGSEVASWTIPIGGGSSAPADPKDLKSIARASGESLTVGFTAFQGIYADNSEFNGTPAVGAPLANATDVWQFVEQLPVQFNFNKDTFIKEVPGFDTYTSGGTTTTGSGGGAQNFTGPNVADHLAIFTAPGEVGWKIGKVPFKAYWDFALNTDGKARVQNVLLGNGQNGFTGPASVAVQNQNRALGDNVAWLAGLQVGQNKKKGDWSIKGDFRQTGLGSVDPNLNDSDFADSFLNQQGVKIGSTYNFTDFLTGSLTYYNTWAYKSNLLNGSSPGESPTTVAGVANVPAAATAATGGYLVSGTTGGLVGLVAAHEVQRVQVDLQWKF